jgi:hypothetical protein
MTAMAKRIRSAADATTADPTVTNVAVADVIMADATATDAFIRPRRAPVAAGFVSPDVILRVVRRLEEATSVLDIACVDGRAGPTGLRSSGRDD